MSGLRYNKKKKPWRSFSAVGSHKEDAWKKRKLYLLLLAGIEAVILVPRYGNGFYVHARDFLSMVRESGEAEKSALQEKEAGETREQGILLDWKNGTVKLWQKVERIILEETD